MALFISNLPFPTYISQEIFFISKHIYHFIGYSIRLHNFNQITGIKRFWSKHHWLILSIISRWEKNYVGRLGRSLSSMNIWSSMSNCVFYRGNQKSEVAILTLLQKTFSCIHWVFRWKGAGCIWCTSGVHRLPCEVGTRLEVVPINPSSSGVLCKFRRTLQTRMALASHAVCWQTPKPAFSSSIKDKTEHQAPSNIVQAKKEEIMARLREEKCFDK